jgi:hypothetical protein
MPWIGEDGYRGALAVLDALPDLSPSQRSAIAGGTALAVFA